MTFNNSFIIFTESFTSKKPKALFITSPTTVRLVTNDEVLRDSWVKRFSKDYPSLKLHTDTKFPVDSYLNAYQPVLTNGDPTTDEGKKTVQAALNKLLPAKYDEIIYDASK